MTTLMSAQDRWYHAWRLARIARGDSGATWLGRPEWIWHVYAGGSPLKLPPEPAYTVLVRERLRVLESARYQLRQALKDAVQFGTDPYRFQRPRRVKEWVRGLMHPVHIPDRDPAPPGKALCGALDGPWERDGNATCVGCLLRREP